MDIVIEKAKPDDADAVFRLLEQDKLPLDGLREHLDTTIVARRGGEVVGVAALEVYGDGVLMRSVAVAPALQGHGLGGQLTGSVLRLAQDLRATDAYLLTTTAERYFPKFGFERIARTDVPASVQASVEFASACPSSATVMRLRLISEPRTS